MDCMSGREDESNAVREEPSTSLVEIEPGVAVVFGEIPPDVEMEPFPLLPDGVRASITDAVAKTLGIGNVGAQLGQGVSEARGIIRLAPETLRQMQAGAKPWTSGGQNLGTLVSKDGEFVSQVRWLPAGGQGAVALMAALGPAAALVAVQFRLCRSCSSLGLRFAEDS